MTIGLFGTCGNSVWRDKFIAEYAIKGIPYYNPQVPTNEWYAGLVDVENAHLMDDPIILFPVTSETTGQGSLAEIGFSCLNAIRRNPQRYFVFMIDDECNDPDATEAARKDSVRSRKLVKSKLIDIAKKNDGVFIINNLDEMLHLSIKLYNAYVEFTAIKKQYSK